MKSLETAIAVLKTFAGVTSDLSVAEVAAATGFKKSRVSKILSAFRASGLLTQSPITRRYSVGIDLFELGAKYANTQQIAREALPVMRRLVDRCGHSSTLSVLHNDHVLHLMAVEGPLYIEGRWRVGTRLPVHATAAGKILLAWLDRDRLDDLLSRMTLRAITPLTITDPKRLLRALAEVRTRGLAVTRGESAPGLAAMAVPVFGAENSVSAALGIVIPDQLFDTADLPQLQAWLTDAARGLSLKLGASTYPFGGAGSAHTRDKAHMRARTK